MKKQSIILAICIATCSSVQASEWKGKGESGFQLNSGNTDSKNINVGLGFEKKASIWGQEIFLGFNNNESNDVETADSTKLDYVAKRDLNEKSFLFAGLNYLDDAFDGLTEQKAASFGYGYRVIDTDKVKFELGLGLGYRDTADAITVNGLETDAEGEDKSGATAVGTLKYSNKITANTEVYDKLRIEPGSNNTFIDNEIGLLVNMSEAYALKAAINTRRNSDPAPGSEATDTTTSLNLVYNFGK